MCMYMCHYTTPNSVLSCHPLFVFRCPWNHGSNHFTSSSRNCTSESLGIILFTSLNRKICSLWTCVLQHTCEDKRKTSKRQFSPFFLSPELKSPSDLMARIITSLAIPLPSSFAVLEINFRSCKIQSSRELYISSWALEVTLLTHCCSS